MRRVSWLMASPLSYLATLSILRELIVECKKLECMILDLWHYAQKFMNFCVDILRYHWRRGLVGLSWFWLGYVSDAHEQGIMGNGIIINPPPKFEHPSRRYC
jgi:hypothetical protein